MQHMTFEACGREYKWTVDGRCNNASRVATAHYLKQSDEWLLKVSVNITWLFGITETAALPEFTEHIVI